MERNDDVARADFARWLRTRLEERGYDLGMRGGGQTRFAEDSGISRPTVSRMLNGTQGSTDTRTLELLADALKVPFVEVLVRAGVLTSDEAATVRNPQTAGQQLTPEQAADELGITDPQARALFVSMVQTLKRPPSGADPDRAIGS
ncbi:helix-turn-helix transcriptional regulator [Streptomyces sp. NBC_00199]|uniref:helix-turn-helix domain-containing protein n=1 Tax=Streptomyces sp. NBC_00199 TaxID=2975678 RepID=UPI0022509C2D|nr:helix-turn-helix transcriptional regulator [Streptomyces sp. NBC_00199]MCX5266051.1 helix-turn-helix transcriptional regulator [Streptomyces sp. NBC_00199]